MGQNLFLKGQLVSARDHVDRAIAGYDSQPRRAGSFPSDFPSDLGVFSRCFAAHAIWHLGYPDQSLERIREAVTLAEELAQPYSRALALAYATILHQLRGDARMVRQSAEAAMAICEEQGFAYYLSWATIMQGWAMAALGQREEGLARMREGLTAMRVTGAALRRPYYLALLAEVCGQTDRAATGLRLLEDARAAAHETGEHWMLADLYRLKGELLLLESHHADDEAEACFRQAFDIARGAQSRSLELRAVMSLARLWRRHGKRAEALALLAPTHAWFTEGSGTADLHEAALLLADLGERA
jgi:adenylate cyclase